MKRIPDDLDRAFVKKYENLFMVNPSLYGVDFPNPFYNGERDIDEKAQKPQMENVYNEKKRPYFNFKRKALCADIIALIFMLITISSIWTKIPWIPFIILTIVTYLIGLFLHYNKDVENQLIQLDKVKEDMQKLINPNRMYERMGEEILCLQVSENLVPVADPDGGSPLLAKTAALRRRLTDTMGYIIPNIRIIDSQKLDKNMYSILVRGKNVFNGRLSKDEISEQDVKKFIDELEETCIKYAHQIMEKRDAIKLIELVRSKDPTLANDLVPMFLSATDIKTILANLVSQRISIKDITYIFEILNNHARYTRDVDKLTEIVKSELNFNLY